MTPSRAAAVLSPASPSSIWRSVDSRLVPVRDTGARLDHLWLADVVIENCELSGAVLVDVCASHALTSGCQLAALPRVTAARLRDVRFINCKLDEANFRTATGERVQLDRNATGRRRLLRSRDPRCTVLRLRPDLGRGSHCQLPAAVLQGSALEALQGAAYLKGVTIDSAQILPFALRLIGAMDICIDDNRSASN